MTDHQMKVIEDFNRLLISQIEKINKKGDITPDELMRMDKAVDIIKDISVICAMEDYGEDMEERLYSSTGYYGRNSRDYMPMYSHRDMRRFGRRYSRDDAENKMRADLQQKLDMADNEQEREMIMKCLKALDG